MMIDGNNVTTTTTTTATSSVYTTATTRLDEHAGFAVVAMGGGGVSPYRPSIVGCLPVGRPWLYAVMFQLLCLWSVQSTGKVARVGSRSSEAEVCMYSYLI